MRIKKTTVSISEIASFIDLEIPDSLSSAQKARIKSDVGELLIDHILLNVGKGRSPLGQGAFPALSDDYRNFKRDEGAGTRPNLELSGEMLDSLKFEHTDEGIKIYISGEAAPRADGHNNFSGDSRLPLRRFLPSEEDEFPSVIVRQVQEIISENIVDSDGIKKSDIAKISSKSELNSFLKTVFPLVTPSQAKNTILVDDNLRTLFSAVLVFF